MEVAVIITDGSLSSQIFGPSLVIHCEDSILDNMSSWCIHTFTKNNLLKEIKESKLTIQEAEKQVLEFIKTHVPPHTAPLAGNSCYTDRSFIKVEMPLLDQYLHEDNLDVSSMALCCLKWQPSLYLKVKKSEMHRGLDDIKESIEELKVYKYSLFN